MRQHAEVLEVNTRRGLVEITAAVRGAVERAGIREGLLTVFIRHTSASLLIQENADPSARQDLETFLDRLVPEGGDYVHTAEGPDDMPSHIKAALTRTSEQVPIVKGEPLLGVWQGIFVWEHRRGRHRRQVAVHVLGE